VTDRRHLLRLELAVCALAATVLLTVLVIGIDAVRFHRATLGVPVLLLGGVTFGLMSASLGRQEYCDWAALRAFR